jgi:hypothetical protein
VIVVSGVREHMGSANYHDGKQEKEDEQQRRIRYPRSIPHVSLRQTQAPGAIGTILARPPGRCTAGSRQMGHFCGAMAPGPTLRC